MRRLFLILLCCGTLLTGCATRPTDPEELKIYEANNDPLEPMNRTIFGFNMAADTYVLEPAVKTYRFVLPSPVRQGINNFFSNLKQPLYLANALMQGDGTAAGTIVKRFAANTFWGFFGLFDTASHMNIPVVKRDFGETLAVWGVENGGPYLVLPLIGPSNVRDTVGMGVDSVLTPVDWLLYHERGLIYARQSIDAFRTRDNVNDLMETLRKSSTDFYATLRSMSQQNRKKEIDTLLGKTHEEEAPAYDFAFPDDEFEEEE